MAAYPLLRLGRKRLPRVRSHGGSCQLVSHRRSGQSQTNRPRVKCQLEFCWSRFVQDVKLVPFSCAVEGLPTMTSAPSSFATPAALAGPPADMPIPNRLNLALVIVIFAAAVALLWLGSAVEKWYSVLAVGIVFSYVLLTNYALLHEAAHGNLHSSSRINFWLGLITGALFPIPFTLIRTTHQGHHLRNRTDFEMFDLYYPTDNRLLKYGQWYSILCGLFWPIIPLGAVLFAVCPALLRTRVWRQARSSSYLVSDVRGAEERAIRW